MDKHALTGMSGVTADQTADHFSQMVKMHSKFKEHVEELKTMQSLLKRENQAAKILIDELKSCLKDVFFEIERREELELLSDKLHFRATKWLQTNVSMIEADIRLSKKQEVDNG